MRLILNYSTSAAGSIQVELQNIQGEAIPGFSIDECVPIIGDRLDGATSWKSGQSLSKLAGTPVRIRFVLQDADLYSLQLR